MILFSCINIGAFEYHVTSKVCKKIREINHGSLFFSVILRSKPWVKSFEVALIQRPEDLFWKPSIPIKLKKSTKNVSNKCLLMLNDKHRSQQHLPVLHLSKRFLNWILIKCLCLNFADYLMSLQSPVVLCIVQHLRNTIFWHFLVGQFPYYIF